MSWRPTGLLLVYLLSSALCAEFVDEVTIQALAPKGVRVILPDDSKAAFYFEAKIYRVNASTFEDENVEQRVKGFGSKVESTKQTGGWIFEDLNVEVKKNQYIVYKVFVSTGFGYSQDNDANDINYGLKGYASKEKKLLITSLVDASDSLCLKTITKVRGQRVCSGQIIFEDNFDSFRADKWQIAHYIPIDHPEHPFVSYQRLQKNQTVTVKNGMLRISPKLQQDLFVNTGKSIWSGTLDLTSGCTDMRVCSMSSNAVDIVPPVVSGRVTSAHFAFTYGTVHVRAKLPKGDWLYPEILLEPLMKKYGNLNYASGVMKIAMACGNTNTSDERYSNKCLVAGPILNPRCRSALEFYHKNLTDKFWGDDFHEYTLKWTPEEIILILDGVEWGRFQPEPTGLRSWLPISCRGDWYEQLKTGSVMAPFDDYFYLTLGVAVGGVSEFSDGLTTGEQIPKPWRNRGRKAGFSFWHDKEHWLPTWTQPDLLIDYVKVVAL